ncbi:hypothetical protein B0H13DRAFT_2355460 [Mycena leptocephala]|nr:hypothetical protein B0H13DRAFT_2355460 [Mycena leptocephala]
MFQLNSTLLLYRALTTSDSDQAMWRVSPTDIARSVLVLFSQLRRISRPAGLGRRPDIDPFFTQALRFPVMIQCSRESGSTPLPSTSVGTSEPVFTAAHAKNEDQTSAREHRRVIVLLRDAWRIQTGALTKRDAMPVELFLDAVVVLPWCGSRAAALRRPPPSPSASIFPAERAMRLDTVLPSGPRLCTRVSAMWDSCEALELQSCLSTPASRTTIAQRGAQRLDTICPASAGENGLHLFELGAYGQSVTEM